VAPVTFPLAQAGWKRWKLDGPTGR